MYLHAITDTHGSRLDQPALQSQIHCDALQCLCRWLNATFGKVPTVGWQIDPFGHSSTHASLMCGILGFDALFFGRADYQVHASVDCL